MKFFRIVVNWFSSNKQEEESKKSLNTYVESINKKEQLNSKLKNKKINPILNLLIKILTFGRIDKNKEIKKTIKHNEFVIKETGKKLSARSSNSRQLEEKNSLLKKIKTINDEQPPIKNNKSSNYCNIS